MKYFLRNQKGFTLMELILVIAIIALLAGVVAPRFISQMPKAESSAVKAQITNLRSAVDVYRAEQGQFPSSMQDLVAKGYMRTVPTAKIKGQQYQYSYNAFNGQVMLNAPGGDFENKPWSSY